MSGVNSSGVHWIAEQLAGQDQARPEGDFRHQGPARGRRRDAADVPRADRRRLSPSGARIGPRGGDRRPVHRRRAGRPPAELRRVRLRRRGRGTGPGAVLRHELLPRLADRGSPQPGDRRGAEERIRRGRGVRLRHAREAGRARRGRRLHAQPGQRHVRPGHLRDRRAARPPRAGSRRSPRRCPAPATCT